MCIRDSFFKRLADEGALPVRLYVMVRADSRTLADNLADIRMVGYGNNHLTVRSIKRSIDGALGSHGAWLLEPYADMPQSVGLQTVDSDEITRTADVALDHGFQVNITPSATKPTVKSWTSLSVPSRHRKPVQTSAGALSMPST